MVLRRTWKDHTHKDRWGKIQQHNWFGTSYHQLLPKLHDNYLALVLVWALGLALEMVLVSGWEMDLVLGFCLGNVFVHSCISAAHFQDNIQNS